MVHTFATGYSCDTAPPVQLGRRNRPTRTPQAPKPAPAPVPYYAGPTDNGAWLAHRDGCRCTLAGCR